MRWFRRSRKPGATQNGLEGPDQVDADALADLVLDADAAEDDRFVCSTCGRTDLPCEVHHVRKMADMAQAGFAQHMQAARLRKRVVLCQPCHRAVHAEQETAQRRYKACSCGEPDALKGARPVRRGAEQHPH